MLEIKSGQLTWVGPKCRYVEFRLMNLIKSAYNLWVILKFFVSSI